MMNQADSVLSQHVCRRLLILRAIGPLTVTIISIAITNIWHLQRAPQNIRVVGKIPKVCYSRSLLYSTMHSLFNLTCAAVMICCSTALVICTVPVLSLSQAILGKLHARSIPLPVVACVP